MFFSLSLCFMVFPKFHWGRDYFWNLVCPQEDPPKFLLAFSRSYSISVSRDSCWSFSKYSLQSFSKVFLISAPEIPYKAPLYILAWNVSYTTWTEKNVVYAHLRWFYVCFVWKMIYSLCSLHIHSNSLKESWKSTICIVYLVIINACSTLVMYCNN